MGFFAHRPIGAGHCHPRPCGGFSNPFSRVYGRPYYAGPCHTYSRPWFPRPYFPSFSFGSPFHFRATSFYSLEDRAFSAGVALTALALGILLCVIL
jgi:hypothetical protein